MSEVEAPFAVVYPGDGSPDNAVLRCLGERGVPVAVATSALFTANTLSRYCKRSFRVPHPEKGGAAVIDRLIGIARELGGKPVLFMLHDFAVMLAAKHRDRLREHYRGHFLSEGMLEVCNRHEQTIAAAGRAAIPAPRTVLWPGSRESVESIPGPWIVKPVSKYVADGDGLWLEPFMRRYGRKAFFAASVDELRSALGKCDACGIPVVVQEYIPGGVGDLVTVVAYCVEGRVEAHAVGRKIRQAPPDCGTCTYGESCPDTDGAAELAGRLLSAIGYEGIAEVEFKRDRRDGRLKLIEVNPRPTVFCTIAGAQGVNLPERAYRHLTNGPDGAPREPKSARTIRWMDPYRDLLQSRGGDDGRASATSLRQWLRDVRGADLLCWGGWRDPLPLVAAPVQGVVEWLGGCFKSRSAPKLGPVKGPADPGFLEYWEERSHRRGLSSVMWSNEGYNQCADRRQKELIDAALPDVAAKRILDLCCGKGRISIHLAERGAHVTGLDLPCMVESAQTLHPHPRVRYVGGDAETVDLPSASFDVVLTVGVLPCLCPTAAKLDAAIGRISGLLKPGGRFVCLEPFHECPGLRRPLHLSPRVARERITRSGLTLVGRDRLLFLPCWLVMARAWWRAPRAVTSGLFWLGERVLRIPGLGALSDYKMFVYVKDGH